MQDEMDAPGVTSQDETAATSDAGMKFRWYIVQAHSGAEQQVADSIMLRAKIAGISKFIKEVLVPKEDIMELRGGRKIKSSRKFFPGYMLAHMVMTDATMAFINEVPKVLGFLGPALRPTPISDTEAQLIVSQVKEGVERPKPSVVFHVGEQVSVSDGPFASFNGVVEVVDIEKSRLRVTVSIFGRETPVELEYSQVEKL